MTIAIHPHYAVRFAAYFGKRELVLGRVIPTVGRWIGRCKNCKATSRVAGTVHHLVNLGFAIIGVDGLARTSAVIGDYHTCFAVCTCGKSVSLKLVRDSYKPRHGHDRHECNGVCLAASGPNCECKCKGANHGKGR